ncbi:MAG: deoxycytidylate deaminase [Magnetococcales bacterium]|nr:deoxycytidylate deaminase [Magnetococcales bacterium]
MGQAAKKTPAVSKVSAANSNRGLSEVLEEQESLELVLGFSGPTGSGVTNAIDESKNILEGLGYRVFSVKLSKHIENAHTNGKIEKKLPAKNQPSRISWLQEAGTALREATGEWDILAQFAIKEITLLRTANKRTGRNKNAYIIDQLKHPDEVNLLETVYGELFHLIGVLCTTERRKLRIEKEEHLSEKLDVVDEIMRTDQNEGAKHGQKLEKTLKRADFFLRTEYPDKGNLRTPLERFFCLIHGRIAHEKVAISPNANERAMFTAYSAGLGSACLSRQVGAAITDKHGNILATGRNDVPKAGGGLYTADDNCEDKRCVVQPDNRCSSDVYKGKIEEDIVDILRKKISLAKSKEVAKEIRSNTRLGDLLEFSRAVHAEMDALTTVARLGGAPVQGGHLYTTVFPCHHCARHIVSSGISEVYYIEPYEKSLVKELHTDSIIQDPSASELATSENKKKVRFIHFEGVSPNRFSDYFLNRGDRKGDGRLQLGTKPPKAILKKSLQSYLEMEKKALKALDEAGFDCQFFEIT